MPSRQEIKDRLRNYRLIVGKCQECGWSTIPEILEFHHKNSNDKRFSLSEATYYRKTINKIDEEIDKCVLLCPNCHRSFHYKQKLLKEKG